MPTDFAPDRLIPPPPTARQREREGVLPPDGPCLGYQDWNRLLFLHWRVPAEQVQATLPAGLYVDTFGDQAYLGLVPFWMERIRPRFLPPLPWLSWFLEYNVRTYVYDAHGRPGVWFYSLDCNQPIAVEIARHGFHLPYEHARMQGRVQGNTCELVSRRRGAAADRLVWTAARSGGRLAEPDSLESFLVERYRLFAADRRGRLYSGQIRHAAYRLHTPQLLHYTTEAPRLAGFHLEGPPVSALAAETAHVSIFPLRRVPSAST